MWIVLVNALTVVAGLIALYAFGTAHPWMFYVYPIILLSVVLMPYWRRVFGYWIVRRDLSSAEDLLHSRGITPKTIIAFDRSSGIYAGMLAQRYAIGDYLVLPRAATKPEAASVPRQVSVGEGLRLGENAWRDTSNILILVFHLRTGSTLEAGMEFLKQQHIEFRGTILAIYAAAGGAARWPSVLCVHRIMNNVAPNENFPWIRGLYQHL